MRVQLPPGGVQLPAGGVQLPPEAIPDPKRPRYKILSIDGGGIRGIIPAMVLAAIENETGKPISKLFDLIGGTSTGGILGLGLTKPKPGTAEPEYSANDLLDLYIHQGPEIFRRNPYYNENANWRECLTNYKYLTPELFDHRFEGFPMSSALTDVVVIANRVDAVATKMFSVGASAISLMGSILSAVSGYGPTSILSHDSLAKKVHLFTNSGLKGVSYKLGDLEKNGYHLEQKRDYRIKTESNGDYWMSFVSKVTSAAPGFFASQNSLNGLFVDGGVLQNNPAIPCVLDAHSKGKNRDDLFMVSLGTGINSPTAPRPKDGLLAMWFETTQQDEQEQDILKRMVASDGYHRIQCQFEEEAPILDDIQPQTIATLVKKGGELVEQMRQTGQLRAICKILDPESEY